MIFNNKMWLYAQDTYSKYHYCLFIKYDDLITVKVFRLIKDSMIILDMVIHYSDWEQFNKYWKVIREIPVPEGVEFAYSFNELVRQRGRGFVEDILQEYNKTADEVDYFVVIRN
ncbi:MAG: hypothetical protein E7270_01965 [Lachnospiraceae bacterium]|nr:hypothetical protein [Lachnospiraceae bacterium]